MALLLAAPGAQAAPDSGSILVIMDVSGSMQREDASGTTLIAGARQAVRQLVAKAPGETPVGLRLYGHRYPGDNERRGCRDSELVVPIGAVSQTGERIGGTIDGAKPTGFTPIGYSLQQAAKDFPAEGTRTIVLVSDGEDTCGTPSPCQAARRLGAQGINVRVDTVGLFLQGNAQARKQLQCVADATGGKYYGAEDAGALTRQLTTVSQRAIQRFETSGGAVDGGPAATQSTPIEAGAPYVDDVRAGEARWYSFEAGTGQVVAATLTEDGSTEYGCCLDVTLHGPDFDRISGDNGYNRDGTARSVSVATSDQGLEQTGDYYLEVRLDDGEANRPVSYEFTVELSGAAVESASPSPTPTPSPTPSPTTASATAIPDPTGSATEETSEETTAAVSAADDGGGDDGLLWALVGLLVLVVLLVIAAMAYMFRRLRGQPPMGPAP